MKRFKKVLALVLAGVLALAMLTACDGTTDPDKIKRFQKKSAKMEW